MDICKKIIFFFVILTAINANALDTKVSLELMDKSQNWDVGEIKDIQIILYPITDVHEEDLKNELMAREFIDLIKVINVKKQYFLRTNPEYYIVEATAVLARAPKANFPRIWTYKGMALGVDLSKVNLVSEPAQIKEFIVFDKKVNQSKAYLYSITVLALLVVLVIICFAYHKIKIRKAYEDNKKLRIQDFRNARERVDHELIYKDQNIYKEFFDMNSGLSRYLNVINDIQYKRDWSSDDLALVNKAHSEVKEKIIAK